MPEDAASLSPDPYDPIPGLPAGIPMARAISAETFAEISNPLLLKSEPRSRAWADIGIVLLLLVAFEVTIGTLMGWVTGTVDGVDERVAEQLNEQLLSDILIPMLTLRGLTACLVVYLIARHRCQSRASVGLRSSTLSLEMGLGLITPPVVYGISFLTIIILSRFRPGTFNEMQENAERLMEIIPPLAVWAYVPLAVLIGVYEELLFRGFLMPRIRRATGSWLLAVVVSTGLFTLLHAGDQTAPALIMVTILSLAFSLLTIWRRSLVPAIVAHTLWDLAQFLILHFLTPDALS